MSESLAGHTIHNKKSKQREQENKATKHHKQLNCKIKCQTCVASPISASPIPYFFCLVDLLRNVLITTAIFTRHTHTLVILKISWIPTFATCYAGIVIRYMAGVLVVSARRLMGCTIRKHLSIMTLISLNACKFIYLFILFNCVGRVVKLLIVPGYQ